MEGGNYYPEYEEKIEDNTKIFELRRKELLEFLRREDIRTGQEETGKVVKRNAKTMEELVDEIIIRNRISDTLERFDKEGKIKGIAIQIGAKFEKREKEGQIKLDKNRKATATTALLISLEEYLPWYKKTLNNGINIKAVAKREKIMKEFGIINKK